MSVENANYINQLDQSGPDTFTDYVSEGALQLRTIKKALVQSLPNVNSAVIFSSTELNELRTNMLFNPTTNTFVINNRPIDGVLSLDSDSAVQPRSYNDTRYVRAGVSSNTLVLKNDQSLSADNYAGNAAYSLVKVDPTDRAFLGDANIPLTINGTTITVKGKLLQDWFYPVGSLYENALVDTNPATLLGFGTWSLYGQGRVTVCLDENEIVDARFKPLGRTGGAASHKLTIAEMPAHNHTLAAAKTDSSGGAGRATTGSGTYKTSDTGGGQAHNNCQPYIVVYRWVRTA